MMRYRVNEIFSSFQGEGVNMGQPCTFIRLQGCNLACPWCDSKNTWKGKAFYEDDLAKVKAARASAGMDIDIDEEILMEGAWAAEVLGYTWWTLDAIEQECVKDSNNLVVITGGEPLLQDAETLIRALVSTGFDVAIETNGTLPTAHLQDMCHIVCSPKIPNYYLHPECCVDEIKLVADGNLTEDKVRQIYNAIKDDITEYFTMWIQPCDLGKPKDNQKSMAHASNIVYNLRHEYSNLRLGIQAHKYWEVR